MAKSPLQESGTVLFAVRLADNYWDEDQQPCEGARRAKVAVYDRRTFQTEEEHDRRFPFRPWRSEGVEHDCWEYGDKGGIRRRLVPDDDGWVIDLTTSQIVDLAIRFGSVSIDPPRGPAQPPRLTLGWAE